MSEKNNQQSYTFSQLGQLFERLVIALEKLSIRFINDTSVLDPPENTESKPPVSTSTTAAEQAPPSSRKPASSAATKKASKHEEVPTNDELITAMKKFAALEGKDKMRALLKEFGAKTASEVPFGKRASLIKRCISGG